MDRYVVSYKLIKLPLKEVVFVDFDDPWAIYVNDESFDQALKAACEWIIDHDLSYYNTFDIIGIKKVFDS